MNVQHFAGTRGQLAGLIYTQSAVLSYADATFLIGVLCILSIPLVFLLKKPRKAHRPVEIGE